MLKNLSDDEFKMFVAKMKQSELPLLNQAGPHAPKQGSTSDLKTEKQNFSSDPYSRSSAAVKATTGSTSERGNNDLRLH